MKRLFAAFMLLTFCAASIASAEEGRPQFQPALEAHLAAIVCEGYRRVQADSDEGR